MVVDKDGRILNIGDRVRYGSPHSNNGYEFTIDSISSGGWIWGSDIPINSRYYGNNHNNNHKPTACELIITETQPWDGNILKFKFLCVK